MVLESLLERAGQLVTREELRKRLWPDDTFVDFDNGLNNAISRVRAALGDSAESPRFIETLGRRGYRFRAPAEPVSAGPGAEERGTRTRHRFGDVSFDVRTRQLWRRGREIHLTRKAFELLVLLIDRRPNAISKEEIHARLADGDRLRVGSFLLTFRLARTAGETRTRSRSRWGPSSQFKVQ